MLYALESVQNSLKLLRSCMDTGLDTALGDKYLFRHPFFCLQTDFMSLHGEVLQVPCAFIPIRHCYILVLMN